MPCTCVIYGCRNRQKRGSGVGFFLFPSEKLQSRRRALWITAVKRINKSNRKWNPSTNNRVCGNHFLLGKPHRNSSHPDFVPSVFSYKKTVNTDALRRYERFKKRQLTKKQELDMLDKESNESLHPKSITEEKNLDCQDYLESFLMEHQLEEHLLTHTEARSYQCAQCEKTFTQKSHLTRHETIHNGLQFRCSQCPKSFTQKFQLTRHELIHFEQKKFTCSICKKSFNDKYVLSRHIKTHDAKTNECKICHEHFKTYADLMEHNLQKSYKCDICNETFDNESNLVTHKWLHTGIKPYQCGVCNEKFSLESDLITHMQNHGEKPYKCIICNKLFKHKTNLRSHIHMNEKPYKCGICGKLYKRKLALSVHEQSHLVERLNACSQAIDMNRSETTPFGNNNRPSVDMDFKKENSDKEFQTENSDKEFQTENSDKEFQTENSDKEFQTENSDKEFQTELIFEDDHVLTDQPTSEIEIKKEICETEFRTEIEEESCVNLTPEQIRIKKEKPELCSESENMDYILGPSLLDSALEARMTFYFPA